MPDSNAICAVPIVDEPPTSVPNMSMLTLPVDSDLEPTLNCSGLFILAPAAIPASPTRKTVNNENVRNVKFMPRIALKFIESYHTRMYN
jgi:hypothetical protein